MNNIDRWNLVEKWSIWTTVLNNFMEKYNLYNLEEDSFISKEPNLSVKNLIKFNEKRIECME